MKYIVINGLELMMCMPHIEHTDFYQQVRRTELDVVTGAGFISDDWRCYGESVGLGVGVGRNDQSLIDFARARCAAAGGA